MNETKIIQKFFDELGTINSKETLVNQRTTTQKFEIITDHDQKIHLMISQIKEIDEDDRYTFEIQKIGENNARERLVFQKSCIKPIEEIEVQIEHKLEQINSLLKEMDMLHVAGETIQNFIDNS